MLKILIYALPLILAVYALVDLVQTESTDVQGLPKLAWAVLIFFFWILGPLAWFLVGRRGRGIPGLPPRVAGPDPGTVRRPMAPDDDPDFLRSLRRPRPPDDEPKPPAGR